MLVIVMFVFILTTCSSLILMAHAGTPVNIKIAWLQYPSDWDTDEPGARITLLTSPLKPTDWNISWDVINLDTAAKEDFLPYDLIVITSHSIYSLTASENEKLEYFVNNGGTLWIDSCGGDFQLNGFFLSVQFTPEVNYQGQDLLKPGHPLLNNVYVLSEADVNALGEGSMGQSSLILEGYDGFYEEIIREHVTGKMLTLEAIHGSGIVVVTAQDIMCALQASESEDLMLSYNIIARSAEPPVPMTVSISPTSASIIQGQSVAFSSIVSGGTLPYSYQWYVNSNLVSGATSSSWTFTSMTSGIYYVYLKVTDAIGNTTQSETARITVAALPAVGGYALLIEGHTTAEPLAPYIALIAIFAIGFTATRRKITRETK